MRKKRSIKNFHKKLPDILWFVLGVVITLWTLLWLLISMNLNNNSTVTPVILFGIGFYAMITFILGTLIYYICKFAKKIKKRKKAKHKKHTKKKTKKPVKKKVQKKKIGYQKNYKH